MSHMVTHTAADPITITIFSSVPPSTVTAATTVTATVQSKVCEFWDIVFHPKAIGGFVGLVLFLAFVVLVARWGWVRIGSRTPPPVPPLAQFGQYDNPASATVFLGLYRAIYRPLAGRVRRFCMWVVGREAKVGDEMAELKAMAKGDPEKGSAPGPREKKEEKKEENKEEEKEEKEEEKKEEEKKEEEKEEAKEEEDDEAEDEDKGKKKKGYHALMVTDSGA